MTSFFVGYDSNGEVLAKPLMTVLDELGVGYTDMGDVNAFYPITAERVAKAVTACDGGVRGLLVCGTGIGMAISANKVKGAYAAVCHELYSTQRAVLSNNANIICMGAQVIGVEAAKVLLRQFAMLEFADNPRSTPKLNKIKRIEEETFR